MTARVGHHRSSLLLPTIGKENTSAGIKLKFQFHPEQSQLFWRRNDIYLQKSNSKLCMREYSTELVSLFVSIAPE